jgi:transcriptional regulator with XRE-family HTH domain
MTGNELKKRRKAADMTQAELAEALGLCPSAISQLERGRTPITRYRAGLINRTLRAQPGESVKAAPVASQTQPVTLYDIVYSAVQAGVAAGVAMVMQKREMGLAYAAL